MHTRNTTSALHSVRARKVQHIEKVENPCTERARSRQNNPESRLKKVLCICFSVLELGPRKRNNREEQPDAVTAPGDNVTRFRVEGWIVRQLQV